VIPDEPLRPYAIGTAARLAGVPAETLRMWERRYGFTDPGRTGGGHRLYSDDDVVLLRAIKKLVDGGARVGSLAALDRAALLDLAATAKEAGETAVVDPHEALINDILDAARSFDTARAGALLDRPRLMGEGREAVRLVYLPLLRRVGELWEEGGIPVAVEHFVEKLVSGRMHAVLASIADGGSGRRALCACPSGERHEAGLIAAAIELRTAGYAVALLGADTPTEDIAAAVEKTAPDVLVLALTMPLPRARHDALVRALDRAPLRDVPLVLGGRSAAELAQSLKRAVLLPPSLDALAPTVQRAAR
jgi:DNA-binding transcriptional MerR regulator